jgi:hypothetical protein
MCKNKNLVQVDAYIGTHDEEASRSRCSLPTLNCIVKNCEEIERSFIHVDLSAGS